MTSTSPTRPVEIARCRGGRRRIAIILAAVATWSCAGERDFIGVVRAEEAEDRVAAAQFDRMIAPLLARRCLGCHNATDRKGGLDLSAAGRARAGGEQGIVLVPGNPEE